MKTCEINSEQIQNHLNNEWLVTNGLGGYACGTIGGAPFRKYHSLLNSSLPTPYGRTVMLNYVADQIILPDGNKIYLSDLNQHSKNTEKTLHLVHYRVESGIPYWKYEIDGIVLEKSLFLVHRQNTLMLTYSFLSVPKPFELRWRPYLHFRNTEQHVDTTIPDECYTVQARDYNYEITCPHFPPLRIYNDSKPSFILDSKMQSGIYYAIEEKRGYPFVGNLSSPGYFSIPINENTNTTFIVSTESWSDLLALEPQDALHIEKLRKKNLLKQTDDAKKHHAIATLVQAADQFLITPTTRSQDMIRLHAAGERVRSVIAGYPWFTDWGRDTMISLEGLTLSTGRFRDAYAILHTFAHYIKDGLIPNMFPDGEAKGIYNTSDATLWFFHAIDRYVEVSGDEDIIDFLLPKLRDIINAHLKGTKYGIHVDDDGLLIQGAQGYQLTWMDAKLGDWVVTPRRGKAVEINGLWYNALRLFEKWSDKPLEIADKCQESFNQKFWFAEGKYLYDVIEGENGNDPALRPNQLLAISLKYPVLNKKHWRDVVEIVTKDLLTPVGLRTLSPSHHDYKASYDGDLLTRDGAYHQGTVWPWLIGPYIDAWLKVNPQDFDGAHKILKGLVDHLNHNCMGTIPEIFDAEAPYHDRGCFAQAWSVAEVLRCLVKIAKADATSI